MQTGRVGVGRRVAGAALTWSLGMIIGVPQAATAAGSYKVTADAGVVYNSNVFDLAPGLPLPQGVTSRGDTIQTYTVAGQAALSDSATAFTVNAKGARYEYGSISYLSHYEESAGANLRWHSASLLDLQLEYDYVRSMAPFAQTLTTALALDTNKTASAVIGLALTPVWRLEVAPDQHVALTPLLGLPNEDSFPDFRLDEKGGSVSLDYLGVAHLTAGVSVSYDEGAYSHIVAATKFHQVGGAFVAKYKIDELSNLTATLGYTTRNTVANPAGSIPGSDTNGFVEGIIGDTGRTGGFTGNIAYSHTLSPKTTVDVNFFRMINSYIAGANSVLSTGAGGAFHWKPDFRFDVTVGGQFQEDEFTGQVLGEDFSHRVDHSYLAQGQVHYAALSWLDVGAHTSYTRRDSNLSTAGYSAFEIGVDLVATLQ